MDLWGMLDLGLFQMSNRASWRGGLDLGPFRKSNRPSGRGGLDLGLSKRADPYTRGGVLQSDVRIRCRCRARRVCVPPCPRARVCDLCMHELTAFHTFRAFTRSCEFDIQARCLVVFDPLAVSYAVPLRNRVQQLDIQEMVNACRRKEVDVFPLEIACARLTGTAEHCLGNRQLVASLVGEIPCFKYDVIGKGSASSRISSRERSLP